MPLNILLVEDNPYKLQRVQEFLRSNWKDAKLAEAKSFSTASQAISEQSFDLVIADMSLPTFDKSATESGGRFRSLGGREIGRKLAKGLRNDRVVFMTQYQSFGDAGLTYTFAELEAVLRADLKSQFLGMIYFDTSTSAWKDQLTKAIGAIGK